MQCYTERFTKQGLYAIVAYHWVIELYSREENSVLLSLTVHVLFSLSYFVIIFLISYSGKTGWCVNGCATHLHLSDFGAIYILNVSGKRCLLSLFGALQLFWPYSS